MKTELTPKQAAKTRIKELNKTIENAKKELELTKYQLETMNQMDDSSCEDYIEHVTKMCYKYQDEFIYIINAESNVPIKDMYGILNYDTILNTISIKFTETDGGDQGYEIKYNDKKYVLYDSFINNAIEIPYNEFRKIYYELSKEMSIKIVNKRQ